MFHAGNKKTLWGFTSTSRKINTSYNFLGGTNFKEGTIFTFSGDVWGYDITLFNTYNENEILLEPERKLLVKETKPPVSNILYTRCKILETPLVLENIIQPNYIITIDSKIFQYDIKYKKYLIQ